MWGQHDVWLRIGYQPSSGNVFLYSVEKRQYIQKLKLFFHKANKCYSCTQEVEREIFGTEGQFSLFLRIHNLTLINQSHFCFVSVYTGKFTLIASKTLVKFRPHILYGMQTSVMEGWGLCRTEKLRGLLIRCEK